MISIRPLAELVDLAVALRLLLKEIGSLVVETSNVRNGVSFRSWDGTRQVPSTTVCMCDRKTARSSNQGGAEVTRVCPTFLSWKLPRASSFV